MSNSTTIKLPVLLSHVGKSDYAAAVKQQLENLPSGSLPLHKATNQGGLVNDSDLSVSLNRVTEQSQSLTLVVNIFFTEIVAGCNCNDDPVEVTSCCEMQVVIDKDTAEASFNIISAC